MGKACCSVTDNTNNEILTTMTSTYISRKSVNNSWIAKSTNDVKVMRIHSSPINLNKKSKALVITFPNELTEKPVPVESVKTTKRDFLINLRVPTNFKIEPLHFREEKSKEFLYDKYIFEEMIGQGSFGEVRKVKDKLTSQYRAIKILKKTDCKITDNYVDEIEILKKMVITHYNT